MKEAFMMHVLPPFLVVVLENFWSAKKEVSSHSNSVEEYLGQK
jgi:hypothetical protein